MELLLNLTVFQLRSFFPFVVLTRSRAPPPLFFFFFSQYLSLIFQHSVSMLRSRKEKRGGKEMFEFESLIRYKLSSVCLIYLFTFLLFSRLLLAGEIVLHSLPVGLRRLSDNCGPCIPSVLARCPLFTRLIDTLGGVDVSVNGL